MSFQSTRKYGVPLFDFLIAAKRVNAKSRKGQKNKLQKVKKPDSEQGEEQDGVAQDEKDQAMECGSEPTISKKKNRAKRKDKGGKQHDQEQCAPITQTPLPEIPERQFEGGFAYVETEFPVISVRSDSVPLHNRSVQYEKEYPRFQTEQAASQRQFELSARRTTSKTCEWSPEGEYQSSQAISGLLVAERDHRHEHFRTLSRSVGAIAIRDFKIPKRVSVGTRGIKCKVEVNVVSVKLSKSMLISHFNVICEPRPSNILLRSIFNMVSRRLFLGRRCAYDGGKNAFVFPALESERQMIQENVTFTEAGRLNQFLVILELIDKIRMDDILRYMDYHSVESYPKAAVHALDIFLRQKPMKFNVNSGRSFFMKTENIELLGEGIELWNGFCQTIIIGWKPYMNIDVAQRGIPIAQNVLDHLRKDVGCNEDDFVRGLSDRQLETLNEYIKGLKVIYVLPSVPGSKRVYRVNKVTDFDADEYRFVPGTQQIEMSATQYYADMKRTRINYPKLKLLHVGSLSNNIYIPMETQCASYSTDDDLIEIGIRVNDHFQEISARVLDSPMISYADDEAISPYRGVWNGANKPFKSAAKLNSWGIINTDSEISHDTITKLTKMICDAGGWSGMKINRNPFIRETFETELTIEIMSEYFSSEKVDFPDLQIVVVILRDQTNLYSRVKIAAEQCSGLLTQCIKSDTVRRITPGIVKNLVLKMNAKLDGINHIVESPCMAFQIPIMFIGGDIKAPSADNLNYPAVTAITASYESSVFRYHMEYRLQPPGLHVIKHLEEMVYKMLDLFEYKTRGCRPLWIWYYRNSVNESHYEEVLEFELTAIRQAVLNRYNGYHRPPITILTVQKNHHIRFFPVKSEFTDKSGNVLPGTIIDTEITHPQQLNFYLTSHSSIEGTARPTKYHLLWDDSNTSTDDIEEITYHLCFLLARCNKSVSYPAPVYYASLAANRVGYFMEEKRINASELDNFSTKEICGDVLESLSVYNSMFFI